MKNIKRFDLFESSSIDNNSYDFPDVGEITELMSGYLDEYDKDIYNYDACYLTILRDSNSFKAMFNSAYLNIDKINFSYLFEDLRRRPYLMSKNGRKNLLFTKNLEFPFRYPNWDITRPLVFSLIDKSIKENKIKAYPIIKFNFLSSNFNISNMIKYKIEDEIEDEWKSFVESLKFFYNQTGFRPFASLYSEEYVDEDNGDVHSFLVFNGFFIDCDDDEYENLYVALESEYNQTYKPTRELIEIFLK